jgi:single-strand DNA-binding protein
MAEMRLGSLNKVLVMGRLTRDPDSRYTPSGTAVLNMGLAVSRRYPHPSGEWREEVCFINVVAWQKLAERLAPILRKGTPVLVEGRLQSRSWEGQDGQKRNTIEVNAQSIQVLERRDQQTSEETSSKSDDSSEDFPTGEEDDIPF